MSRFHINNEGNVNVCSAKKGRCPFGSESEHYPTSNLAREAFERDMERDNPTQKALTKMKRINIKAKEDMLYEEFKNNVESAPVELLKIALNYYKENVEKENVKGAIKPYKEIKAIFSKFADRYGMDYKNSWAFKTNFTLRLSQPKEKVAEQIRALMNDMKDQIDVLGEEDNAEFILSSNDDNTIMRSLVVNPNGRSILRTFNYGLFSKREKNINFDNLEKALDHIYDLKL